MELKKSIPFRAGVVNATIFGGPFRQYETGTRRLVGVKMAREIDHPHDISIPTKDYSVPDPDDMIAGLLAAIERMAEGNDLYVGCLGGIGRTGLFMAVAAKTLIAYHDGEYAKNTDPVKLVRAYYLPHAVETSEQLSYVASFDVGPALDLLRDLQPVDRSKYISRATHNSETRFLSGIAQDAVLRASSAEWRIADFNERSIFGKLAFILRGQQV